MLRMTAMMWKRTSSDKPGSKVTQVTLKTVTVTYLQTLIFAFADWLIGTEIDCGTAINQHIIYSFCGAKETCASHISKDTYAVRVKPFFTMSHPSLPLLYVGARNRYGVVTE